MATRDRQIFVVRAEVVDANYSLNSLSSSYPKKFDSENAKYDGSEDRCDECYRDARAEYDTVGSTIIKAIKTSGRIAQKCSLETFDGEKLLHYEWGSIPPVQIPDPTPPQNQDSPELTE